jgi:hypothetical protein
MTETSTIYLAGVLVPAADLPDFKAIMPRGETKFKIVVSSKATFTAAQIAACVLGSTTTAGAGGVSYSGTVTGFGCREGYRICQIDEAEVAV